MTSKTNVKIHLNLSALSRALCPLDAVSEQCAQSRTLSFAWVVWGPCWQHAWDSSLMNITGNVQVHHCISQSWCTPYSYPFWTHYLFNLKKNYSYRKKNSPASSALIHTEPYHHLCHCLSLLIAKQAMLQAIWKLAILWWDPYQQATDDNHTVHWLKRIINLLMVIRRKYNSVCGKQSLLNNSLTDHSLLCLGCINLTLGHFHSH